MSNQKYTSSGGPPPAYGTPPGNVSSPQPAHVSPGAAGDYYNSSPYQQQGGAYPQQEYPRQGYPPQGGYYQNQGMQYGQGYPQGGYPPQQGPYGGGYNQGYQQQRGGNGFLEAMCASMALCCCLEACCLF
jgi:hypothetical protein